MASNLINFATRVSVKRVPREEKVKNVVEPLKYVLVNINRKEFQKTPAEKEILKLAKLKHKAYERRQRISINR